MVTDNSKASPSNLMRFDVEWDGSADSGEVDLQGAALLGVDLPAGFTGSAITVLRYSYVTNDYTEVLIGGAALQLTVTASKAALFANIVPAMVLEKVVLRSDASETCSGEVLAGRVLS